MNLQFDEAQYWDWSRHVAFGYVSKPPMIAWVIAATTGLFGDSEAGIRAAAPLLHAITALALYALGTRLYDKQTGFWCAVVYATLPSVAYSSLVISTDAVLLPFWAIGLFLWWQMLHHPSRRLAVGLGMCIGLGLLAKYAMVYFVLGMAAHLIVSREARAHASPKLIGLVALAALIVVSPNLWWNLSHGWATFSHTAENADWLGARKGGVKALLEFLAGQIGIFGPVLGGVAVVTLLHMRRDRDHRDIFLACFSLPVLLAVTIQCLIAGAHLNWAALAYVSLVVLVVKECILRRPAWLAASTVLHMAIVVFLCFSFAGFIPARALPKPLDPFEKLRDWSRMATLLESSMRDYPGYSLLFDERKFAVLFNYYMRNKGYTIVIWPFMGKNHSQFAMTNSIDINTGKHAVLISRWAEPHIEHDFARFHQANVLSLTPRPGDTRIFYLFACDDLTRTP